MFAPQLTLSRVPFGIWPQTPKWVHLPGSKFAETPPVCELFGVEGCRLGICFAAYKVLFQIPPECKNAKYGPNPVFSSSQSSGCMGVGFVSREVLEAAVSSHFQNVKKSKLSISQRLRNPEVSNSHHIVG